MKWYQKAWFTWLMLLLITPVGIILLWKYRTYSSKVKFGVTVVFAFLFLAGLTADKQQTNKEIVNEPTQQIEQVKQEEPKQPEKQLAPEIQTIINVTGMNEEQAQNLNNILLQCGIDKYTLTADNSMDNLRGLNEKAYVIQYANKPEIIMLQLNDKSIYTIICKGKTLYNGKTNTVELSINDINNRNESQSVQQTTAPSTTYIASSESDKFHKPKCRAAKKINSENAIYFTNKDEAINAGYSPCGICNP